MSGAQGGLRWGRKPGLALTCGRPGDRPGRLGTDCRRPGARDPRPAARRISGRERGWMWPTASACTCRPAPRSSDAIHPPPGIHHRRNVATVGNFTSGPAPAEARHQQRGGLMAKPRPLACWKAHSLPHRTPKTRSSCLNPMDRLFFTHRRACLPIRFAGDETPATDLALTRTSPSMGEEHAV